MMQNHDAFESILDDCLREMAAGRLSVEDCLRLHPREAAELAPLLTVAARVRTTPRPTALSADKRRAIEQQLLNRAVQSKARVSTARRPLRLRFGFAAVLIALVLAGIGAVAASATSLPGELLYPVKRLSEQVSLTLAPSSDQAALHVDLAQHRLDEFDALAERGEVQPELMTEASQEITVAVQAAEALSGDQRQAVLEAVIRVADTQLSVGADTTTGLAPDARSVLTTSAAAASAARERAVELIDQGPRPLKPIDPGKSQPTATFTLTPTLVDVSSTPMVVVPTMMPTETPKIKNTLPVVRPTDRPTHTPRPLNTPPGLVKTPKPTEPKPEHTPPGHVGKTPKPLE
jgi:hypothetical protein